MSVVDERMLRREIPRVVAALVRMFGHARLALAEDVAQDAMCRALETWSVEGVPTNGGAWLMTAARNCAFDVLRRERTAGKVLADVEKDGEPSTDASFESSDDYFAPAAIRDEQLRMMFSCCDPRLGEDAQLALILNVLCGFDVAELAQVFLTQYEAMKKRLSRAKASLGADRASFALASKEDVAPRLELVQRALYLLFSEGFHGGCATAAVRQDVCGDAMHLAALLLDHPLSATPDSIALAALMCFHAARLPARLDAEGRLLPMRDQDRRLWDRDLIAEGERLMSRATGGDSFGIYHVEAAIAAAHVVAPSIESTDWRSIVALYDLLLGMQPSPVVALQRAVALAELEGAERGLRELARIENPQRLAGYPFYAAAKADLLLRCDRQAEAKTQLSEALALARNDAERAYFRGRIEKLSADVP